MRDQELELLRIRLQEIKEMGWIKNRRPGNAGGVGNTLEDLLDVAENNLQLPDFGNWELKSQRAKNRLIIDTLPQRTKTPKCAHCFSDTSSIIWVASSRCWNDLSCK